MHEGVYARFIVKSLRFDCININGSFSSEFSSYESDTFITTFVLFLVSYGGS